MTLGIYIPTYGRADKLASVADNIKRATNSAYKIYWGVEKFDQPTIDALSKIQGKIIFNTGRPCYSDALQSIYESTKEKIFFWANDDFFFIKDWDVKPLELLKNESICVLGVHDGNPNTRYFSMSFIRRKYIEEQSGVIDMPNRVLYPYHHNYVDDELSETAIRRGVWSFCDKPCILHQHHSFTWLGDFKHDDTYKKNDAKVNEDRQMFEQRRHLWTN
jgi:hypothetical protein